MLSVTLAKSSRDEPSAFSSVAEAVGGAEGEVRQAVAPCQLDARVGRSELAAQFGRAAGANWSASSASVAAGGVSGRQGVGARRERDRTLCGTVEQRVEARGLTAPRTGQLQRLVEQLRQLHLGQQHVLLQTFPDLVARLRDLDELVQQVLVAPQDLQCAIHIEQPPPARAHVADQLQPGLLDRLARRPGVEFRGFFLQGALAWKRQRLTDPDLHLGHGFLTAVEGVDGKVQRAEADGRVGKRAGLRRHRRDGVGARPQRGKARVVAQCDLDRRIGGVEEDGSGRRPGRRRRPARSQRRKRGCRTGIGSKGT